MAYSQVSDLKDLLTERQQIELTDDDPTDGEMANDAILQRALDVANSQVDSYVAKRFPVPLTSAPESVRHAELVLAKRWLYLRRDYMPEDFKEEVESVLKWLIDVANGRADLPEVKTGESEDVASFGFGADALFGEQIW